MIRHYVEGSSWEVKSLSERVILHSDMNCFYASVEMLHHPEFAGMPLAVGGDPEARHGIVLTANYIAKKKGVKTGMALWQAKQVCPEIIFVPPRMDLYLRFSQMAREIYSEYQVQFQRFDTIKKKHWSPTTVSAIVRDEIYIGTRIWGKTRCSMHTGHKAVLNDETEWVRLENHHTAIIDRELFEKANEMHPKKKRSVAESRTNFTLERRKKQPALLICANCGHSLLKETEHLLKCSDARTNGDPVCRSLVIRREPMEENILGLVRQYAASMLKKGKKVSSKRQCEYKEINTTELQKQSRQLTSEKMKLYDDYKDGRIDRDSYKQRAEKISVQLDEIKRKIEDAKNSKKLLEQNELSDKIKLKDFLGIQKFDTEKLREVIKVIRVHSQDEIEIEWNFDDIFSEQR